MGRDGEVDNASPLMRKHQKYIEDLEPDRRHHEEVDRNHRLQMILEESAPSLLWWPPTTDQIFTHAGFADLDAEFEQLTMNAWSSPNRIFAAHRSNQLAHLFGHARSSGFPTSNLPAPEKAKALAVPADN